MEIVLCLPQQYTDTFITVNLEINVLNLEINFLWYLDGYGFIVDSSTICKYLQNSCVRAAGRFENGIALR